jgi:hypothetical protein
MAELIQRISLFAEEKIVNKSSAIAKNPISTSSKDRPYTRDQQTYVIRIDQRTTIFCTTEPRDINIAWSECRDDVCLEAVVRIKNVAKSLCSRVLTDRLFSENHFKNDNDSDQANT